VRHSTSHQAEAASPAPSLPRDGKLSACAEVGQQVVRPFFEISSHFFPATARCRGKEPVSKLRAHPLPGAVSGARPRLLARRLGDSAGCPDFGEQSAKTRSRNEVEWW